MSRCSLSGTGAPVTFVALVLALAAGPAVGGPAVNSLVAAEWQPVAEGVEYQHVERESLDAHVARVDLNTAGLRLVTTRKDERGLTVSEFAARNRAIVAVNGDYFDAAFNPIGLAMGACGVWAQPMEELRREEVVGVGKGRVRIFPRAQPLRQPKAWMSGAVSGWPTIVDRCDPVAALPGSDFFTRAPHPRTALGLSADGRQLYLVVVDGRREGVPGLTLPELAQFMDELGACTAVNLDGGGSSVMWLRDRIVNQPSDVVERSVANHIAVVAVEDYRGCEVTPADDDVEVGPPSGTELQVPDGRESSTDAAPADNDDDGGDPAGR